MNESAPAERKKAMKDLIAGENRAIALNQARALMLVRRLRRTRPNRMQSV